MADSALSYYDRDGQPIALEQWAELVGEHGYRRIACDVLVVNDERVEISTVWLGLNHNWMGGRPLIFETMVFGGKHDMAQWRYATIEEAREGHDSAVELVKIGAG